MTIQEIKTILNNSRLAGEAYSCAAAKRNAFRDSLTGGSLRYDSDGGTHERDGNPRERALCKLADMDADVERLNKEMLVNINAVFKLINTMPDSEQKEVLHKRYIFFMSWREIGEAMCISSRQAIRLHGYALRYLSENT